MYMENLLNSLFDIEISQASKVKSGTLVARTYASLRDNIISGHLKPNTKLRIEGLREHYKVGAGTLREALGLLVADALVVTQGQKGFRVAPMSAENFYDIAELRILLESKALRSSINNGNDQWEALVISTLYTLSKAEKRLLSGTPEDGDYWLSCNKDFHEALLSKCTSRWTLHFLHILWGQGDRYRRVSFAHYPGARDVHGEHDAIKEAAIARDCDKAIELLVQHINAGNEIVGKALENNLL